MKLLLYKRIYKRNGGQAVILTVIFFLIISVAVIASVVVPTANQVKSVRELLRAKSGYVAADAVNADGFYRLRLGRTLPGTLTLPFSNTSVTAAVTSGGGITQIKAIGTSGAETRYAQTTFSQNQTLGFPYALQIGTGGISINGGSRITGDVYSNGNIVGDSSGPTISGSATAANTSASIVDISNGYRNATPPLTYKFAYNSTFNDLAQSFQVSTTVPMTAARVYVKKTGSPGDFTLRVTSTGSNGLPSVASLASANVKANTVTSNFTYITVPMSPSVSLTPGATYWLIFDHPSNSGNTAKYYTTAAADGMYASGGLRSGTWGWSTFNSVTPATADAYFDIFLGGLPSSISGAGQNNRINIGTGGSGFAWGNSVNSASVSGIIYCQAGNYLYNLSNSVKSCDATRPDPTTLPSLITDTMISNWKTTAATLVYTGNLTLGGGISTTTGPLKIVGNLTVTGGSTMNISGPVWVTGSINLEGGSKIRVPVSAGANGSVIISDGRIFASGGGEFLGSGTAGSYLMAITTSACPTSGVCTGSGHGNAIDVEGGSGSVILVAPNGKVGIYGGAVANNVVAKELNMDGGSEVIYDNSLSNIGLVGTGGSSSFDIESWAEVSQ